MRRLTNLDLCYGLLIVFSNIPLFIYFDMREPTRNAIGFIVFVTLVIVVGGFVSAAAQAHYRNTNSVWVQPVSQRTARFMINAVAATWLVMCVGIIWLLLQNPKNPGLVISAAFVGCVLTMGVGRYLSRKFGTETLLPYVVSSFGMLPIVLLVVAFA